MTPKPDAERIGPLGTEGRIEVIDVLRGVAILGILVMNIRNFALPLREFQNPFTAGGGMWSLGTWLAADILFEDKMISILSLLFGAGIVLIGGKTDRVATRRILVRRNVALLALGLAHAYLVWYGDILNTYAFAGLMLFALRGLRPRTLLLLGIAVCLSSAVLRTWPQIYRDHIHPWLLGWIHDPPRRPPLTEEAAYTGTWIDLYAWRAWLNWFWHFRGAVAFNLWRCAGMMLIGMALMKARAFAPEHRARTGRRLAALGYGLGLPLVLLQVWDEAARHPGLQAWWGLPPVWDRISGPGVIGSSLLALGHTGLVLLLCRPRAAGPIRAALAAAGRLALTNYLVQSVICVLVFDGWAGGQWGRWSMAEQILLVFAVWAAQLAWSPFWLRRHDYGPVEWLWRWASYGRRPSAARRAVPAGAAPAGS